MIRNREDCQTPSHQDSKGKEKCTYSNGTTIKTLQAESQKDSFFPHPQEKKKKKKKKRSNGYSK